MIKVEKMSEGCEAKVEDRAIHEGQLLNQWQLNRLTVRTGEVMYTVNEQSIMYRTSKGDTTEPTILSGTPKKEPAENTPAEATQEEPEKAPIEKPLKTMVGGTSAKNNDSGKSTQNSDSGKSTQNSDSGKST